jgi:hypothetical protein
MISYADLFALSPARVQVNVGSPAGAYASSSTPFFHYVVRLSESNLPITETERRALELLGAIPHAFFDEDSCEGPGWRVVPPCSVADWPVLETEPRRLREALYMALDVIWRHAAAVGISAREIGIVDQEIENVLFVVNQAEQAGFKISMSYVS